jgi:hypothetical protein
MLGLLLGCASLFIFSFSAFVGIFSFPFSRVEEIKKEKEKS